MQFPAYHRPNAAWRPVTIAADFVSKLWPGHLPRKQQASADGTVDIGSGDPNMVDPATDGSPTDPASILVNRMLAQGRQALLLRPELVNNLTPDQRDAAQRRLRDAMAYVEPGRVNIVPWKQHNDAEGPRASRAVICSQTVVDDFWLDRRQVSNAEFQEFVGEGGYHHESYWAASARSRMGDFTDRTGTCGPRFWTEGRYPPGLSQHPVVGICWFEADAFARWQGRRLPTDAEWMKAASCPQTNDDGRTLQRLYPWGDEPKIDGANLWGANLPGRALDGTVATDQLPAGATDAGIEQLLGNVWEWTASEFQVSGDAVDGVLDRPLISIRGGAFDTYFGEQATCNLQSGDHALARKHNVGFRCAVGAADVAMTTSTTADGAAEGEIRR